jgi:hypothetical protein
MTRKRNAHKIFVGRKNFGREETIWNIWCRQENTINMYLKYIASEFVEWIYLAQNIIQRWADVTMASGFRKRPEISCQSDSSHE